MAGSAPVDNYRTDEQGNASAFGLSLISLIIIIIVGVLSYIYFGNEVLFNAKFRVGFPIWLLITEHVIMAMLVLNGVKFACMRFSPQFIADNVHDSISLPDDQPYYAGWQAVKMGGTKYPVPNHIYWSATAIFPQAALTRCGANLGTKCQLHVTDFAQLPTNAKLLVYKHRLKPPFHFGILTAKQLLQDISAIDERMSSEEKDRILKTVGKFREVPGSTSQWMLSQECQMHDHTTKDKAELMTDLGRKKDLQVQLSEKTGQYADITDKVAGKKKE